MIQNQPTATCPAKHIDMNAPDSPALTHFHLLDGCQDEARPVFRNTEAEMDYWVFTDNSVILDGLQHPELWSSSVIVPTDPEPPYKWIPIMIDPPDHAKWRQVLAEYFSPGRVKGLRDAQQKLAAELVDQLAGEGGCDFVARISRVFPSTVFLTIMGMPVEDLDKFLAWEDMILHQSGAGEEVNAARLEGMTHVMGYFSGLIQQRLDTVSNQLSYAMLHLATHPADRARIVAEPELIPKAVEELLRVYPIVQTARKATQDMDFHGCPVKAGDMASFSLAFAGRDAEAYPDARTVDLDRGVTRHLSFGGGPHRCLGSHLARQELAVVLEEWHKRIPNYEVSGQPIEHGGQVFGVDSLNLTWR
jgi:cytochrome P450